MSTKKSQLPKFVHAYPVTGQHIKIPLVGPDRDQTAHIQQYLLQAGVTPDQYQYVAFSTNEKEAIVSDRLLSSYPSHKDVEPTLLPPIPVMKSFDESAPLFSTTTIVVYTSLKDLVGRDKLKFCLDYPDQNGKRNIFDFERDDFVDPSQYDELHSGNIGLSARLAWKYIDTISVSEGDTRTRTIIHKEGVSKNVESSVSTTIGASYMGVTAELTAAFSYKVTVSSETSVQETVEYSGVAGKQKRIDVWQLCDLLRFEKVDASGNYIPLKGYDVVINEPQKRGDAVATKFSLDPLFFSSRIIGSDNEGNTEEIITNVISQTSDMQEMPHLFDLPANN